MIIAIWLLCAILSGIIANKKNRSVIIWSAFGLIFGVFGLLIIAVLPTIAKAVKVCECPYCHADIMSDQYQVYSGIIAGKVFSNRTIKCKRCNAVFEG